MPHTSIARLAAVLGLFATPALSEPPRVVADIAPVHALVAQVMAGIAAPGLLLEQDANPHAVQLRPSQVRMLEDADLLIWVGPALSPWLDRIADTIDADQLVLMDHPATALRDIARPAAMDDDHADADAHDHDDHDTEAADDHDAETADDHDDHAAEAEGHDAHDHGAYDPHLWLSVDNARAWLAAFAEELAARDPDNAAAYRANADTARAGIDALTARIEARLAPHQGAEIVTFHDAFGYFADRFGITIVGSVRPGDAATPSAAAMADLETLVAEHGIVCAYAEPAFDPGLLETIAGDTGLRIGTLDPTGALQAPGPAHYAATLEAVADGIAECLERD